jgi:naphthalene 1,2-dioxygenase system ferredoxin subunit
MSEQASPAHWVRVAALADLDSEYPIQARVGEVELAVGVVDGQPFAVGNICSHAFARLSDGFVQGHEIVCPLHQGSFDVRSGEAVASPCYEPILVYPVKVEGGAVLVDAAAVAARAASAS